MFTYCVYVRVFGGSSETHLDDEYLFFSFLLWFRLRRVIHVWYEQEIEATTDHVGSCICMETKYEGSCSTVFNCVTTSLLFGLSHLNIKFIKKSVESNLMCAHLQHACIVSRIRRIQKRNHPKSVSSSPLTMEHSLRASPLFFIIAFAIYLRRFFLSLKMGFLVAAAAETFATGEERRDWWA